MKRKPYRLKYDRAWDDVMLKAWLWNNRILPRLAQHGECLEWQPKSNVNGYGRFNIGSRDTVFRQFLAHRVSLEVKLGRNLIDGLDALHSCDNPKCCNPNHLREGTHKENMEDAVLRGQHPKGERNGHAKITEDDVRAIRASYNGGGILLREIGEKYSMALSSVWSIVHRKRWKHVI